MEAGGAPVVMTVKLLAVPTVNVLLLALLSLKHLPPDQRGAWKALFDHYIFDATDESVAHIPAYRRTVLGEISPKLAAEVKAFLVKQLKGDKP